VAQTFVYAAESHDLATCLMEGFDARRVQEILRIPDRYAVPLMVATGYEYDDPATFHKTPRLPLSEIVFGDTFASPLMLFDEDMEEEPPTATSKGDAA
jgi:nitroreductase